MKQKSSFYCTECGNEYAKWAGRCTSCGSWNTIVEAPAEKNTASKGERVRSAVRRLPRPLIELDTAEEIRFSTGMAELDRVLGGGIVPGSLVLVGGDPGIGKSTLLLQVCRELSAAEKDVLYVSGEESHNTSTSLSTSFLHI